MSRSEAPERALPDEPAALASRRHPATWRLVALELGSAVLFLPRVVVAGMLVLALPAVASVSAAVERGRCRAIGLHVPEPPGAREPGFLARRALSRRAWVRDVPTLLSTLVQDFVAFTLVALFGSAAAVLIGAPVLVHGATQVTFSGWEPTFEQSFMLIPLGVVVAVVGFLALTALGRGRLALLRALTDDRTAELQARVGALTTSRATLVDAFEAERRRIERDLHDGAQQRLVGLSMTLGRAARAAESTDPARHAALAGHLAEAQRETEEALAALRDTVRAIHPAVLTDRGLFAAVRELASRSGVDVTVTTSGDDTAVTSPVAVAGYFAVSEALTNVAKHAGVASARVDVTVDAGRVRATVADDGAGGAVIGRGEATGLAGLAERLETLGGHLAVTSTAGEGTTVEATAPLTPAWG